MIITKVEKFSWLPIVAGTGLVAAVALIYVSKLKKQNDEKIKEWLKQDRRDLAISLGLDPETYGFVPGCCVQRLNDYYEPWEALSMNLPELNKNYAIRSAIERLPCLSVDKLSDESEWRRAYVLLAQLVHSYVNNGIVAWNGREDFEIKSSERDVCTIIPECLAKPWYAVCCYYDLPPILTATATDCWNFKLKDPNGQFELQNLMPVSSITGLDAERFFHMIPTIMHYHTSCVVLDLYTCCNHIVIADNDRISLVLEKLGKVLEKLCNYLLKIRNFVNKHEFYDIYRLYLGSFENLILQKASFGSDYVATAHGPSAGQSADIIAIDTFLGVKKVGLSKGFQDDMLKYIPSPHRRFLLELRHKVHATGNMHEYIISDACDDKVRRSFKRSVKMLVSMRKIHLSIASFYLDKTKKGTGDSDFRDLLSDALKGTLEILPE